MSAKTGIEWTEMTWNPVAGCSLESPGCKNCYAMRLAYRWSKTDKAAAKFDGLTSVSANGTPVWTGIVRLVERSLSEPRSWKRPKRVFVNSMSDLFHPALSDADIARVWAAMASAPQHQFQVLTKRHTRLRDWLNQPNTPSLVEDAMYSLGVGSLWLQWPLPHVWIGVSVEDQQRANERIPTLLECPGAVRFLSMEPLLERVSITAAVTSTYHSEAAATMPSVSDLDWVIVGGESGTGARPLHPDWVRAIRDECAAASVPFFFKQVGSWIWLDSAQLAENAVGLMPSGRVVAAQTPGSQLISKGGKEVAGKLLDGQFHQEYPIVRPCPAGPLALTA